MDRLYVEVWMSPTDPKSHLSSHLTLNKNVKKIKLNIKNENFDQDEISISASFWEAEGEQKNLGFFFVLNVLFVNFYVLKSCSRVIKIENPCLVKPKSLFNPLFNFWIFFSKKKL